MYIKRLELEIKGLIDLSLGKYKDGCIKINSNKKLSVRADYRKITNENKEVLLTPSELGKL